MKPNTIELHGEPLTKLESGINDLLDLESGLSDYDVQFIEDMYNRLQRTNVLTLKQFDYLNKLITERL